MRLYPKKIRNIEDLERERKRLLKQTHKLEKEEFLSLEGMLASGKEGSFIDALPISNPLLRKGLSMVAQRFLNRSPKQKAEKKPVSDDAKEKKRSVLKTVAVEFIGGYLKWKAIELSYKGIKLIIKSQKKKKMTEQ